MARSRKGCAESPKSKSTKQARPTTTPGLAGKTSKVSMSKETSQKMLAKGKITHLRNMKVENENSNKNPTRTSPPHQNPPLTNIAMGKIGSENLEIGLETPHPLLQKQARAPAKSQIQNSKLRAGKPRPTNQVANRQEGSSTSPYDWTAPELKI